MTSRERLRLRGEHEFVVPPLEVPQAGRLTVALLNQYEVGAAFCRAGGGGAEEFYGYR